MANYDYLFLRRYSKVICLLDLVVRTTPIALRTGFSTTTSLCEPKLYKILDLTCNITILEGLADIAAFFIAIASFLAATLSKTPCFFAFAFTWQLISFCFTILILSYFDKASFIALATDFSSFCFSLSNFTCAACASFASLHACARITFAVLKNYAFLGSSLDKFSFFPRRLFFFSHLRASFRPATQCSAIAALAALLLLALISFLNAALVSFLTKFFENCYIYFIVYKVTMLVFNNSKSVISCVIKTNKITKS